MKNRIARILILVFIFTGILMPEVNAISKNSNPRSVGMAGAYIGIARGFESPIWNPANLMLSSNHRYSVNLINVGVGIQNNSFSLSQYNMYNGDSLTTGDIDDILGSIPSDGLKIFMNTESQILSFASGHLAFSMEALICSEIQMDKNFVEIMFRGNEMDQVYTFDNTDGEAFAVASYNLSGAMPLYIDGIKNFSIGGTIKYLQGFGYMKIKNTQGYMSTTIDGLEANGLVNMEYAGSGKGISFDFGAAAELNNLWTVSLAFKNIISNIQWNQDATGKSYQFTMDPVTMEILENTDTDSLFNTEETESELGTTSSSLPAEMHLGVVYNYNKMLVAADYIQGLNKRPGTSTVPQLAVGMQYHVLPWFPLRTGLAVGGHERFTSAFGFGFQLGAFALDFGVSNRGGFFLSNQRGANLALGIGFWF